VVVIGLRSSSRRQFGIGRSRLYCDGTGETSGSESKEAPAKRGVLGFRASFVRSATGSTNAGQGTSRSDLHLASKKETRWEEEQGKNTSDNDGVPLACSAELLSKRKGEAELNLLGETSKKGRRAHQPRKGFSGGGS